MDLPQVSRTAILTLICRALEAGKEKSGFHDPMAVLFLERLISAASEEDRRWILRERRIYEIQSRDTRALTRRAGIFDRAANRFIAANPKCTVVNLACGFDTRYWRIENEKCRYVEIDLPEVIRLKKGLLKGQIGYEMIGCSVTDSSWMDKVTDTGNTGFLLLAEGLFMWIPRQEAIQVFRRLGEKFTRSQLILDMVPENRTKGIWKFFMALETRISWGLDDVAWVFGIREPKDIEGFGHGLKVIGVEKATAGPIITVALNAGEG